MGVGGGRIRGSGICIYSQGKSNQSINSSERIHGSVNFVKKKKKILDFCQCKFESLKCCFPEDVAE